jgi:phenylacetate-CoA ligase
MAINKDKILKNIIYYPVSINKVLLKLNFAPGLLYGYQYLKRKRGLKKEKVGFPEEKVINLVNYAIKNTPFYSNLYKKPISDIREFSEKLSFIDRHTLTVHFEDLVSSNINRNHYNEVTTGGTSGKPVSFLIPKNRHIVELSTMHRMWERTGWNYHTRGVLRNHKLPKNEVYLINPITKEIIFDNFRLNPEYVNQIHKALIHYKIKFIHAYPSAAYQFCLLCKEQGLDLGFIRAFLCGSEGIIDFQRKLIVDEMGLRLYSFYGHSEKLVSGGYCEFTDHYHIEPQYGYFELIGKNNMPVAKPGEFGEIVGTTLYNYGMPLIRYRTGDFAEYVGDHCEMCGRQMPVIKNIEGRWDKNQIHRKDGTYVTTTALNLHDEMYKIIDGLQYIQEHPGELRVLIIKGSNFNSDHEKIFLKHYSESMGEGSKVVVEYVDKLIMQPNGKFLQLISKIE